MYLKTFVALGVVAGLVAALLCTDISGFRCAVSLTVKGQFRHTKMSWGAVVHQTVLVSCSLPSHIGADGRGCAWTGSPS